MTVRDRPLEVGVNLNTIITAVMLGVMSWVGFNIESIKDKVGEFTAVIAVVQKDVDNMRRDIDRHERLISK